MAKSKPKQRLYLNAHHADKDGSITAFPADAYSDPVCFLEDNGGDEGEVLIFEFVKKAKIKRDVIETDL